MQLSTREILGGARSNVATYASEANSGHDAAADRAHAVGASSGAGAGAGAGSEASAGAQKQQTRSLVAFSGLLRRRMAVLENSRQPAVTEMADLISHFIAQQSTSSDACSSQLLEAK